MNNNNPPPNNNHHHHLQALAAALGNHQAQQASVVSESIAGGGNQTSASDQTSRTSDSSNSSKDNNKRNSVSSPHRSSQRQQLIQPLVDAAPASQGTNLLAGLDFSTQALLLKALQNQVGGGQPPPSNNNINNNNTSNNGNNNSNNSSLTAQQLFIQQIQRLQQQQASAGGANAAHSQAAASQAILAAALAGRSGPAAAAPPPPKPHVVDPPTSRAGHGSTKSATSSNLPQHVIQPSSSASASAVGDKLDKNKRVANRISAHQSRLRKKQYVEELKGQNDELRKLRQIMAVVPDVILAFDSSGIIRFITQSSQELFGAAPEQFMKSSIWDVLCTKSVRRLKAAFMDSLATREPDQTSVPLGNRVWEIRLKDQDPGTPSLSLHGAVHFSSGSPECVCLVRRMTGPPPSASTTVPTEDITSASDEREQSETTSDHTSENAEPTGAGVSSSPPESSEAVSSHETGAAASTEVKPPSVVQAADYNGENKKQGPFDTSSSMSSGSS
eukprot:Nitzschia sp. Nitz4//scaffold181_size46380//17542//19275//NITZ4_007174-RA/size46380-snap-gene-0.6-mRNA-1//1//CDS//3329539501//6017//frame0